MTVDLETGPVFHATEPVADLVLEHSAIPQVLRRHHIDFSIRGNLTLQQLCELNGIPVEVVLSDLERAVRQPNHNPLTDPRSMSPAALMFHIVARHHSYLRDVLSIAVGLALKVERVHQGRDFPLKRIRELTQGCAACSSRTSSTKRWCCSPRCSRTRSAPRSCRRRRRTRRSITSAPPRSSLSCAK